MLLHKTFACEWTNIILVQSEHRWSLIISLRYWQTQRVFFIVFHLHAHPDNGRTPRNTFKSTLIIVWIVIKIIVITMSKINTAGSWLSSASGALSLLWCLLTSSWLWCCLCTYFDVNKVVMFIVEVHHPDHYNHSGLSWVRSSPCLDIITMAMMKLLTWLSLFSCPEEYARCICCEPSYCRHHALCLSSIWAFYHHHELLSPLSCVSFIQHPLKHNRTHNHWNPCSCMFIIMFIMMTKNGGNQCFFLISIINITIGSLIVTISIITKCCLSSASSI